MTTIEQDARIALAAKGLAEQDLARLALCPPWRHAVFAALMAALVVTPAIALSLRFAVLALVFVSIGLIIRSDKRRLGVFINGYRRGRTRWVTFPMLAVILAIHAASVHFGMTLGRPMISVALAALAFGVAYIGSVMWQRVFVHELGA